MIKTLARNKIRLTRGYTYFSALGIPFLVAVQLQKMITFVEINWIIFYIIGLTITWGIGYIDTNKGFLKAEQEYLWKLNPAWMNRNNGK